MAKERAKKLVKIMAESLQKKGGKISLSQAMRDAGYSDIYAANPQKIRRTKTWSTLIDEYLPQELIAQAHQGLIVASHLQSFEFEVEISDKDIKSMIEGIWGCSLKMITQGTYTKTAYYYAPENRSRKDAIDMAYKLRGTYAAEKVALTDPYESLSDDELQDKIAELESKVLRNKKENTNVKTQSQSKNNKAKKDSDSQA